MKLNVYGAASFRPLTAAVAGVDRHVVLRRQRQPPGRRQDQDRRPRPAERAGDGRA